MLPNIKCQKEVKNVLMKKVQKVLSLKIVRANISRTGRRCQYHQRRVDLQIQGYCLYLQHRELI